MITGILIISVNLVHPQLLGNGYYNTPYNGTILSSTSWYPDTYPNGIIYVTNLTVSSGATLSINPGTYYGGLVQFFAGFGLTISNGSSVILKPGTALTVDDIYNGGTLRLESDATEMGVASLIHYTYEDTGGGVVEIRHFLSGGQTIGEAYKWHYISSPVSGINVSTYNPDNLPEYNLAQYIESLINGPDNYPGWVAYDGYQYSSGATLSNTFSTLSLGKGYNYYSDTDHTISLTGGVNISTRNVAVTCGSEYPDYQGYNLLGNPFASCLDWDYIVKNYPPAFVNDAIYFTNNGKIASYVGGIGDNGGTGTIPPLQGFFVKANANSSVSLRESARTHNIDQYRYKKKSTEKGSSASDTISFIRLSMKNFVDSTDLVVRFNKKATSGVDKQFDAFEFNKISGDINIWTETAGVAYSINGLPFPDPGIEIPICLSIKTGGEFNLSSNELNKLGNYSIKLKDLSTNKIIDLGEGETLDFVSSAGIFKDRFILAITKSATAVSEVTAEDHDVLNIYTASGAINIMVLSDALSDMRGSVVVYDMSGRKILQQDNIEWFGKGDLKQITLNSATQGVYIVEVEAGEMKYIEKVSYF